MNKKGRWREAAEWSEWQESKQLESVRPGWKNADVNDGGNCNISLTQWVPFWTINLHTIVHLLITDTPVMPFWLVSQLKHTNDNNWK